MCHLIDMWKKLLYCDMRYDLEVIIGIKISKLLKNLNFFLFLGYIALKKRKILIVIASGRQNA